MKTNNIKRIFIVLICALSLYFSGSYLLEMNNIKSLFDAFNVMIFFTCLFPFLFVSIALIRNFFKSIYRLAYQ